jgi:hypothetical protein
LVGQIYNVDKRVQEDNLQHLALFSEYGRMALSPEVGFLPVVVFVVVVCVCMYVSCWFSRIYVDNGAKMIFLILSDGLYPLI